MRRCVLEAVVALGLARLHLALRPLEANLAAVCKRNGAAAAGADECGLAAIVSAFRTCERFVLSRDTCLLRALALQRVLARHGVTSTVMFGVKLHPFEAHSWVQIGGRVINDTLEQVGLFEPIRAVG